MTAGEQWRPSRSDDSFYIETICVGCVHDQAFRDEKGDSCEIAAAMYRDSGSPEWIIGLDGNPFCKKFERVGSAYRCPLTPDMFKPRAV